MTADLNADSSSVPVGGDARPPLPATEHITAELLEVKVRDVLNQIVDPCSAAAGAPAGLIDMGLISRLSVQPCADGQLVIAVQIRLTEPTCLMGYAFTATARESLARLPGAAHVTVDLDTAMSWNPDQIIANYARRLNNARARKNIALLGIPSPTTPARSTQLGAVHAPRPPACAEPTDTLKTR